MTQVPTIILTGTSKRNQALIENFRDLRIKNFPLIEIQTLPDLDFSTLENTFEHTDPQNVITTVFSINGIESLKSLVPAHIKKKLLQTSWGVVADRSARVLGIHFPSANIVYCSHDGTGAGLAKNILQAKLNHKTTVITFCAERGREEFFDILQNENYKIHRFYLYKTNAVDSGQDQWLSVPAHSIVVFGSPTAVRSFFKHHKDNQKDFRYVVIGPTTAAELESFGHPVFLESRIADYENLIRELRDLDWSSF